MGATAILRGHARLPHSIMLFGASAAIAVMMATFAKPLAVAGDRPRPFSISFDSEWIRLAVIGDSLEIRGTYYLRCHQRTAASASLFYPFPKDSLLGGARMVSLIASVDGVDAGDLGWEESRGTPGVRFRTPSCTGDTITVDAVYRQRLTSNYARYIVTTTKAWHRPLRLARFEIRLPPGATPIAFSFPFKAREDSLGRYYAFEAREFLPDRDIVVRWR